MKAYNQTENEYRPTGNYGLLIKQKESRKSPFLCLLSSQAYFGILLISGMLIATCGLNCFKDPKFYQSIQCEQLMYMRTICRAHNI